MGWYWSMGGMRALHAATWRWAIVAAMTVAMSAVLSGCGWQLQNSTRLNSRTSAVYVDTQDRYSDFYRELRMQLAAAGAKVVPEADAKAVIRVTADNPGQRVASVSTLNRPEQYEVYYRIEYSIALAGVEAVGPQSTELTANYSYDTSAVLAKQREQMSMQRSLARELAGLVLRRLASVGAQGVGTADAHGGAAAGK